MTTSRSVNGQLLVDLILAGKIPGIGRAEVLEAATAQVATGLPSRVRMPVYYCDCCGSQLVTHWFAANPVTQLAIICLFCAQIMEHAGGVVHALISPRGDRTTP